MADWDYDVGSGEEKGLDVWRKKFGLSEDATQGEVDAAARAKGSEVYKAFKDGLSAYTASVKNNFRDMPIDQKAATKRDRVAAAQWVSPLVSENTKSKIAGNGPMESFQSGTGGTNFWGTPAVAGDTHNKTAADWTKEFAPPDARPLDDEQPEEAPLPKYQQPVMEDPGDAPTLGAVKNSSDAEHKVSDLYQQGQAILASGQIQDKGDADEFKQELDQVRGDYNKAKTDLDKRELMHQLADAFTKLGAGYFGAKTGADISSLKIAPTDLSKDRDRALQEEQTNLSDLKSRRQEDMEKRSRDNDLKLKQNNYNLDVAKAERDAIYQDNRNTYDSFNAETQRFNAKREANYQKAMVQIYGMKADNAGENTADKMWSRWREKGDKDAEAYRERGDKVGDKVKEIVTSTTLSDDDKRTMVQSELTSKLGWDQDRVEKLVSKKGFFGGQNMKDVSEWMPNFDKAMIQEYRFRKLKSQLMPNEVLIETEQGMGAAPHDKVPKGATVLYTPPRKP